MTLTRSRSVVRRGQIQALEQKKLAHTHVLDTLDRTTKERGAVGTSTRADACAFTTDLQPSFRRRRFQTGQTPEELAHMFQLLGRVSRHS